MKSKVVLGLIGLALLLGVVFLVLFQFIAFVLHFAPEPIGSRASLFAEGARLTLLLTLASGAAGLVLGVVAGLARLAKNTFVAGLASAYIWVVRGTPLLVQILFVYFTLPEILPFLKENAEFWLAVIALALNVGAYNAEVVRAGVLAVPNGQSEAARSLGLSGVQTLGYVVLPQAFRLSLPPLVNNLVALLKDTSLVSVISLLELSLVGQRVNSETFQPVPVFVTTAFVYLVLTSVLTTFTNALERRFAPRSR